MNSFDYRQYFAMCEAAQRTICQFMERTYHAKQTRKAQQLAAIQVRQHAFMALVHCWRKQKALRLAALPACPVCMEHGKYLIPLHGEARHVICWECRTRVNICPLCRHDLAADNLHDGHQDDDLDYDDDQMYTYD